MKIIPAIDIINGQCVRLEKGDFKKIRIYEADPVEQAIQLEKGGIKHLHIVDLDAAKVGELVNYDIIREIVEKTSLIIDYGGGISEINQVEQLLNSGISAVNIGSLAVKDPSLFKEMIKELGSDKIILSADVNQEKVAINGWQKDSGISIYDFLEEQLSIGVKRVCCTDIQRDGMLSGPAVELYRSILQRFPQISLIASGGVGSVDDIHSLEKTGLEGVIVGKAIYEGKIDLKNLI